MERLILFAKTPRLHEVKTRLVPPLTPAQALALHEAMLGDQIAFLHSLERPDRSSVVLLDAEQGDGDLGARMHWALSRAFADGARSAAILGADAPTLPRELVEDAFARLSAGADAVVVPALDGGYVLVGASHPVPAIFDGVAWGSGSVLETTRRLARAAGVALSETAAWSDVDVEDDLFRLAKEIAVAPARAPATASFLASCGLYVPRNPVL
jgi:hypothetical protein